MSSFIQIQKEHFRKVQQHRESQAELQKAKSYVNKDKVVKMMENQEVYSDLRQDYLQSIGLENPLKDVVMPEYSPEVEAVKHLGTGKTKEEMRRSKMKKSFTSQKSHNNLDVGFSIFEATEVQPRQNSEDGTRDQGGSENDPPRKTLKSDKSRNMGSVQFLSGPSIKSQASKPVPVFKSNATLQVNPSRNLVKEYFSGKKLSQ